jgi:hypothetical protein
METRYEGLPAAASVEQAIILAQVLIMRDLERGDLFIPELPHAGCSIGSTLAGGVPRLGT